MVPSNKWFPSSLQNRAAWYQNFTTQFAVLAAGFGFTAPEIAAMQDDNTVIQFLAQTAVDHEAYKDALGEYRTTVTEGDIGDPTPGFPANPTFTLPEIVPTGIFERLVNAVTRIRAAATFSPEAGALLGINPSSGPAPEGDVPPTLKAFTQPGNVIEVRFTRGSSDGIAVEIKVDNEVAWSSAGRFPKSPAIITVPDGTGLPRAVQLRGRFLDGNSPIGPNSDTVNVVTTP